MDRALEAADAASSKKARNIVVLDVGPQIGITDYFVICSGETERQVSAIVDEVQARLRSSGAKPYRREGTSELKWVLLDYLQFVVHVFRQQERDFYELERLWKDADQVLIAEAEDNVDDEEAS